MLHFYRRLIALRAAEPALIHGRYDLLLERNRQIYAYTRTLGDRGFLIMCNLTSREARYRHRHLPLRHDALALANQEVPAHPVVMQCVLRPFEARVYRIDPT